MCSKRVLQASMPKPPTTSIVSDHLEIRQLLTRGCEAKNPVSLKVRGSETMLRSTLIDTNPAKEGIQLSFSNTLTLDALEKEFELTQSKDCMVLIYLQGRSIIGFNAEPNNIIKDRIIFKAPEKLFKIQRRKDVRFVIPSAYEYTVEIDSIEQTNTRVKKRVVDISEGGLSFFVLSPREAGLFRAGTLLSKCVITMNNQTILVDMRVCNQSGVDRGSKGKGHKIGVVFESIGLEDKKYLGQFIYSHAAHLFY